LLANEDHKVVRELKDAKARLEPRVPKVLRVEWDLRVPKASGVVRVLKAPKELKVLQLLFNRVFMLTANMVMIAKLRLKIPIYLI
jgi:hypothetical protein